MERGFSFDLRSGVLDLNSGTKVMGILNLTPDSFSDGGELLDPGRAIDRGLEMEAQGAAILDLGACSTRPGAEPVAPEEELSRLLPVVGPLAQKSNIPISIDTYHASVFRACFDQGAEILNDVSAMSFDEEMAPTVAELDAPSILMHMQGDPKTMQENPSYNDVVADLKCYFSKVMERVERFGVSWAKTILDPGIGFGKTVAQNVTILRRFQEFHELGRPLLMGASRKSFLGQLLDREDPRGREFATSATTAFLFGENCQIVRVHDVQANVDTLRILEELKSETNDR